MSASETASRSPLPERAGIELVRFDWTDESTHETARKGVDAMYLIVGIAAVAAAALTEDGHGGKAYAPVGPESLTLTQVAEHLSWVAGRRIRYVETDRTPMRRPTLPVGPVTRTVVLTSASIF